MEMWKSICHDGNDTYNGKGKESILYTTALYIDSIRRTAYQLGYLVTVRSSSPFVDPD